MARAIEDERWVDAIRADRQLRRSPPTNIATCTGPDEVEPRRLNLGRRLAHLGKGVGTVELIEAFEDRILGFQEGPPHRDWRRAGGRAQHVVDDRAVG
ncbi:hypothetical protein D3C79_696910 [compost metagenome]